MASNGVKAAATVAGSTVKKVGRMKKIGQFFGNIYGDYKAVAVETWQDISEGSIKAAVYLTSLAAAGILIKSNPSEQDLEDTLLTSAHDLSLVGGAIRNKESDGYIDNLRSAQRDGRLHHTSLGVCSLVWVSDNRDELDLYEAKCKHTHLAWYEWYKRVEDIGVLGKYMNIEKKMKDFDINKDEWGEQS